MSSTSMKLIALIFMFIDHIGEFIPHSPIWFRYIGRLALPIFFIAVLGGSIILMTEESILSVYMCLAF